MKTIRDLLIIFILFTLGWWALFIATAEQVNTVSKLDYRVEQAKQAMEEVRK